MKNDYENNVNEVEETPKITKTTKKCENNKYYEILQGHGRKVTRKCKWGRGSDKKVISLSIIEHYLVIICLISVINVLLFNYSVLFIVWIAHVRTQGEKVFQKP